MLISAGDPGPRTAHAGDASRLTPDGTPRPLGRFPGPDLPLPTL
jgi:hypothetical protein